MLIVFVISGLWHGAGYTFLIWGFLHGIYQIIGKLTLNTRNNLCAKLHLKEKTVNIYRTVVTFLLVCFAWISFRSNNINDMLNAYKLLFTSWNLNHEYFVQISSVLNLDLFNKGGYVAAVEENFR